MAAHPAIALIVAAEFRPVFRFATAPVEELLAVASQTEPTTLPRAWVARLAQRFADVLLQQGALDRATSWLETAERHVEPADVAGRIAQLVLRGRQAARGRALEGADAALGEAARLLARWAGSGAALPAPSNAVARHHLRARLELARAEVSLHRGAFAPVLEGLVPLLSTADAFLTVDDVWRAHRLVGHAHQTRLDFQRAIPAFSTAADVCAVHEAPRDEAETRIALAQCLLGVDAVDQALTQIRAARALAAGHRATAALAAGLETTAVLSTGDLDGALDVARRAAVSAAQSDDYLRYVEWVGVVTHLHRVGRRYEAAYRALLGIHGQLVRKFGADAGAPIRTLIDTLRGDLGDAEFEALSARILAEQRPQ